MGGRRDGKMDREREIDTQADIVISRMVELYLHFSTYLQGMGLN
jgi:hypothetical protein